MSFLSFCIEIIKREGKKFNVGVNTTTASQITAATASDVNFDVAHNRCSFLYRCGLINLTFARDCFKKFFSEKSVVFLLSKWIQSPDMTVCSISNGPALDYIALLLSYQEYGMLSSLFKNVKVISKYGAWRNTVNTLIEVISDGYLSLPSSMSIEVIQGDPFVDLNEKVKEPICNSDIVLMVKTLNLQVDRYDANKIAKGLQDFIGVLKPGAIIFCIDTKPSISMITHQLCTVVGSYLFEPTHMNTKIDIEYADFFKDTFGCLPVASARGSFFVWQKSSAISSPNFEGLLDEVTESVKQLLNIKKNENSDKLLKENEQVPSIATDSDKNNTILNINKTSNNNKEPLSKTNIGTRSLKYSSSPSPSKPSSPVYIEENIESNRKPASNSIVIDQATQTEPENPIGTDSTTIIELTNRIAKLTATVSEMILTNEADEYEHSIVNNCLHNHCSQNHPSSHLLECVKNIYPICKCYQNRGFENCYQNHVCQRLNFTQDECSSKASLNDFEVPKNGISCDNSLKVPTENNSISTPKLVIPLNNLSGNSISQILSIINQSNQEA